MRHCRKNFLITTCPDGTVVIDRILAIRSDGILIQEPRVPGGVLMLTSKTLNQYRRKVNNIFHPINGRYQQRWKRLQRYVGDGNQEANCTRTNVPIPSEQKQRVVFDIETVDFLTHQAAQGRAIHFVESGQPAVDITGLFA